MWYRDIDSMFFSFCHKARVCQTDGRTDRITISSTAASRDNNGDIYVERFHKKWKSIYECMKSENQHHCSTPYSEQWGVSWTRWPRGSALYVIIVIFNIIRPTSPFRVNLFIRYSRKNSVRLWVIQCFITQRVVNLRNRLLESGRITLLR